MKLKFPLVLQITFASLLLLACAHGSTLINGVNYDVVYYGSNMPTDATLTTPAWLAGGSLATSGTNNSPSSGIFSLTTTAAGNATALLTSSNSSWDGTKDSIVEFKMKVDSQVSPVPPTNNPIRGAVSMQLSGGSADYILYIADDGIRTFKSGTAASPVYSNTYTMDTTTGFNTYRLVLNSGLMDVYVNDFTNPVITGYGGSSATSSNRVMWGDPTTVVGGVTEWEYVAFTSVPEPSTAALFGVAVLAAFLFKIRRRNVISAHRKPML